MTTTETHRRFVRIVERVMDWPEEKLPEPVPVFLKKLVMRSGEGGYADVFDTAEIMSAHTK